MITTVIFRETTRNFHHHHHHHHHPPFSLLTTRSMGGGPRTFPGGLNKWQWKRLHEKKAREKEKRLLDQEKQLYQARIRSHIRASVSGSPEQTQGPSHSPMSPKDQIKALANRFIKSGAEDLWNDDDGPVHSPTRPGPLKSTHPPFDGRNFGANLQQNRGYCLVNLMSLRGVYGNLVQKRGYGSNVAGKVKNRVYYNRGNGSSSSDDEEDYGRVRGNSRWPRIALEGSGMESEEEGEKSGVRGFMGNATLGKHDVKVTKRRIVKELEELADNEEESGDYTEKIEEIRHQVMERKRAEEIRAINNQVDEFVGSGKR